MALSVRSRIYWSFLVLIIIFLGSTGLAVYTLNRSNEFYDRIYLTIDPSVNTLEKFRQTVAESKTYVTNRVYVSSDGTDVQALTNLHENLYPSLKKTLKEYAAQWQNFQWKDSLATAFTQFEEVMLQEKDMMKMLNAPVNFPDSLKFANAKYIVAVELMPRFAAVQEIIYRIIEKGRTVRAEQVTVARISTAYLRNVIIVLALLMAVIGILLSVYMVSIITHPVNRVRTIVQDLAAGRLRRLPDSKKKDEIGEMKRAVNKLSDKLQSAVGFATAIGERNFETEFEPVSEEDTLGKALISMRDNLRSSEKARLAAKEDFLRRNRELEEFSYIVSHNLRAPVANITGLWHMFSVLGADATEQQKKDIFQGMALSVEKLDKIISDLNNLLQTSRG